MSSNIEETLKAHDLFSHLNNSSLKSIAEITQVVSYNEGEALISEQDESAHIFILIAGEVGVYKNSDDQAHQLATLGEGELLGELALTSHRQRSATVKALTKVKAYMIEVDDLLQLMRVDPQALKIYENLSDQLSQRMKDTTVVAVESMQKEFEESQKNVRMAHFILRVIILLCGYTVSLRLVQHVTGLLPSGAIVGVMLLILGLVTLFGVVKHSNLPLRFYGLTLENWRAHTIEAILFTLPILLLMGVVKYLALLNIPAMSELPFFTLTATSRPERLVYFSMQGYFIFASTLYFFSVVTQELIIRGILQSNLTTFFTTKNQHFSPVMQSVLTSNFIFATMHIHINFGLVLATFFLGLFWGWLYARQDSLVGPLVSHLLIGYIGFFVLGLQAIPRALAA